MSAEIAEISHLREVVKKKELEAYVHKGEYLMVRVALNNISFALREWDIKLEKGVLTEDDTQLLVRELRTQIGSVDRGNFKTI